MKGKYDQPRYSIQLVARRTGLSPPAIRAWERRYGAISPTRSATRRRLYSDSDIERLCLLRRVTLAGRQISSVAGLEQDELEALIREDRQAAQDMPLVPGTRPSRSGEAVRLGAALAAIQDLDARMLEATLRQAAFDLGAHDLIESVLTPLLHAVGERWSEGALRIYQEHLASAAVRAVLENLRLWSAELPNGPGMVVTTPVGQLHDLGALMVAVIGRARGWRATFLGPNLPAEDIAVAAHHGGARVVALSLIHPERDPRVESELRRLPQLLPDDTVLLVGGRAASSYLPALAEAEALAPRDSNELIETLDRLRS